MKRIVTATAAFGLGLMAAAPVLAVDEPFPVSGVEVTTDLDNVDVSNVNAFYPEMNADLEKLIWAQIENPQTDGSKGFNIDVKLTEVALDGGQLGAEGEFNTLDGVVTYRFDDAPQPSGTFPIEVRSGAGDAPVGVIVVAPSEADYYSAMLTAFATAVSDKMSDLPAPQPNTTESD
ncbi:MAG: hypothetical protein ACU0DK_04745 [Pseudooceanicola sp.]